MLNYAARIHHTLGPLIPAGSPLARFDFPNYTNVGDSAIWLGESAYLEARHRASPLCWVSDIDYARRYPPTLPAGCVVLIAGGGNFGDIWPAHQAHREWLVGQYPQHRIIQLPQSIYFADAVGQERSGKILAAHPDFHLVVRDQPSLAIAQRLLGERAYLCPDMALHLKPYPRPVVAQHDMLALLRTDKEALSKATLGAPPANLHCVDWLTEPRTWAARIDAQLARTQGQYPRHMPSLQGLRRRLFNTLAYQRWHRGSALLASAKVVITDRLHAHILCTLMNIPHVVLDNSYQKIANLRQVWGTGTGLCEQAESFAVAVEKAEMLLHAAPSQLHNEPSNPR